MEGLEIAEKRFQVVVNQQLRLEAQYHTAKTSNMSEYYLGEEIVKSANYNSIYGINNDGEGYLVLRMHEFDGIFAGVPTAHCKNFNHEDYEQHRLRRNDVLICRTNGNPKLIGKSALVAKDYEYVYESHLFKVCPNERYINSSTLTVFLNSIYGRMEIEKLSMQGNQANFSLAKFKELRIPKFSKIFQNSLDRVVYKSFSNKEFSSAKLLQVDTLLMDSLGLTKFAPNLKSINIKSFKDSFARTGRLDAEHYQPKYEALYQELAKNNRVFKLGERLSLNQRGTQPDYADEGLPVVNSKHVQRGQVNMGDTRFATMSDKANAVVIQQGDVLMNGAGVGTIGRAAPYLYSDKALPDNHVTVLRTDVMSPICLALYLNSIAGQYQVDQHFKGSSGQIELYPTDIANFWCPELDQSIQQQIDKLAQQSFTLKAKSERLLEAAKRAVEIAIEQDEVAGMAYLAREGTLL